MYPLWHSVVISILSTLVAMEASLLYSYLAGGILKFSCTDLVMGSDPKPFPHLAAMENLLLCSITSCLITCLLSRQHTFESKNSFLCHLL